MDEPEYTLEEATELLPSLSESLVRIREARQVILAGGERIRAVATLDGGGAQGKEYWDALATLRREVESMNALGILLRNPETGLVDFPSRREGRQIFLCWQLGEDRIGFWHDPESGFAGRLPL